MSPLVCCASTHTCGCWHMPLIPKLNPLLILARELACLGCFWASAAPIPISYSAAGCVRCGAVSCSFTVLFIGCPLGCMQLLLFGGVVHCCPAALTVVGNWGIIRAGPRLLACRRAAATLYRRRRSRCALCWGALGMQAGVGGLPARHFRHQPQRTQPAGMHG